jgi:hypothetical protein
MLAPLLPGGRSAPQSFEPEGGAAAGGQLGQAAGAVCAMPHGHADSVATPVMTLNEEAPAGRITQQMPACRTLVRGTRLSRLS